MKPLIDREKLKKLMEDISINSDSSFKSLESD